MKGYGEKIGRTFDGVKLLKIPTGYYASPAALGNYLAHQFNKNLPINGHAEQTACKFSSDYDSVTQKISFKTENILDFQMASLNNNFNSHIGAMAEFWEDKFYLTYSKNFNVRKAFLKKYDTMYIYCDAVKYQIVGDTQAPLVATLPIQGTPNDQCY